MSICASLRRPRAALAAAASLALLAATPLTAQRGITPEDVVRLEAVGTVTLSPDGRRVAYTLTRPRSETEPSGAARSELWVVDAAGGTPTRLVEPPRTAGAVAWSPDGALVTFITRIEAQDPQTQVYGMAPAGSEPRPLTRSSAGVLAYRISPDGRYIAYTARDPADPARAERRARGNDVIVASETDPHIRLWIEAAGGGERRVISPADWSVRDFEWAPDSRTLALQMTERTDIDADYMYRRLFTLSIDGGGARPFVETEGKMGPMAWSPDGRQLAWLGAVSLNDPLAQSVFVAPATGGTKRNLTPNYEGSAEWVGWLDNSTVAFTAVERTRTALNRVSAGGGRVERIYGEGAEIFRAASFDRSRRTFAFAANTPRHPNEVYVGSVRPAQARRITQHNPWLAEIRLGRQETIEWTAADGLTIQGVLVRPIAERPGVRYPLTILPHGGPEGVDTDGWLTRPLYPVQVLAAQGYAVLMPNYRASAGRGVAFAKADHRDLGGAEFDDVLRGIDHLAATGLIDPDRVGISGTSYGGYFSAWAATRHSDRFRAAIPFAGLTNWVSFTGTTDIPAEMSLVHWDLWFWDHPELVWDRSPVAHLDKARTPTLIGHGLADERVHPEQSIQLYQFLELRGVPTELLLYPREPHGLRERAHQLDYMHRVLDWFERYLKDGVPATE